MAQRTFTMEVRFNTDDPSAFDTVTNIMQRACRDVFALAVLVAGPGQSKPDIRFFTDDMIQGITDIEYKVKEIDDAVAAAESDRATAGSGDDEASL